MSFQATEWARALPLDSLSAKFTLLMIASYAGTDGTCYPSLSTLADDTLQSVATVRRRIRDLEELGVLVRMARWKSPDGHVIVTQVGDGTRPADCRQTSDELRLVLSVTVDDVRARVAARKAAGDASDDAEDGADAEPDQPGRVSDCNPGEGVTVQPPPYHPGGTPGVSPGCDPLNSNSNTQGTSPPFPPQAGGGPVAVDRDTEEAFRRFATAYPEPITDYARALQAWLVLSASERDDAMLGVKGYADFLKADAARRKGRGRPAKNAHTWLTGRMWLGYLDAGRKVEKTGELFDAAEGSEQWNAWTVFYRCCGNSGGIPEFRVRGSLGQRVAHVPCEWPPVGRGLPLGGAWVTVAAGSGEFAAWLRRLRELDGVTIATPTAMVDGRAVPSLKVPTSWPPSKHGTPPHASDADLKNFA